MIIWDGISNLRSFRVKTGPECSFARFTRNRVARAQEIGFPKFKMHNLAFWDLKDSKVNSRFEFGVVSSLNDKVTAILRFPRKRRNRRERKPRKGRTRGWRLSCDSAELIRSFMCTRIEKHQTSLQIIAKAMFNYRKWHFWPFIH